MLRHRRKPPSNRLRKGPAKAGLRRVSTASSSFLDALGIRPLRGSPPTSASERASARWDTTIALTLLAATLVTRLYRLAEPPKIIFDEYHFAAFVDHYISGRYLFDIHPPLGKLALTAAAKLGGYRPIGFVFDALGKPYGDLVYVPQRLFAAVAGSLIPPVLFSTCRALRLSRAVSATTACMALFDMLLCVESRLILTDSQLILYIQTALLCALRMWTTPKSTLKRYMWVVLTAVLSACAAATKWTALVAPGLIGIVSLTGSVFPIEGRLDVVEMVGAGVVAVAVYVSTFWVHFKLLPRSGPGDAFMPVQFQRTLIGGKHFDPEAPPTRFVDDFRYLNWEMFRANRAIKERHPWESKWYTWLYNRKGVLYLDDPAEEGMKERVYLIMNPVLTVVTGLGVIASLVLLVSTPFLIQRARRKAAADASSTDATVHHLKKRAGMIAFFLIGWMLNLLPYVGVQRCTFLYHVLPALQMACLLTAIALESLPTRWCVREAVCGVAVVAMGATFYMFRAWTYGLHSSVEDLEALRWVSTWT